MDDAEYDLEFFRRGGFRRSVCQSCGSAFWSLSERKRCAEEPCTPYSFVGHPGFAKSQSPAEMRESYLTFFERHGHKRVRRYPVVARWRADVFFVQASIYDFQPWVTSGEIEPPANPLTISQPCVRFIDLEEVGRSGRHFTEFEMMAHHAFNRPGETVYFKERCVELCHELFTSELGADPKEITYKEEVWEGGGNLGPSLSVGLLGLEVATLVFMEYTRSGGELRPMPLTVVDTGYGLERATWMSQGTGTAYEAVFGATLEELLDRLPFASAVTLVDHARALNFLIADGVVPSNTQEGYYARLLLRRVLRVLARMRDPPTLEGLLDRVAREQARDFPELGEHRDDLHRVVEAEVERFDEAIARARVQIRRAAERIESTGGEVGTDQLVEWYDSLGVTPDVAVEELAHPPTIPEDFYARVAARHESESPPEAEAEDAHRPSVPASVPATKVEYYTDPYTTDFRAKVLFSEGEHVVLDKTYFYPTGGGQITDTGHLGDLEVTDVSRVGGHVLHRLAQSSPFTVGEAVRGRVDEPRRRQLMQHHTATHLLNGALREVLGPHVWQAGAFKGPDSARIDITHFRALSPEELARVDARVHEIIREDRPVRSYFESRGEAERRFGFTLYQGGAVPGRTLRIVEIEGFDVEACGGTHCTRTGEVGFLTILSTERIQDGIVRLNYAAGERAVALKQEQERTVREASRRLGVAPDHLLERIDRLLEELAAKQKAVRSGRQTDLAGLASEIEGESVASVTGGVRLVARRVTLDAKEMQELCRLLTREPGQVAILATEVEETGRVIVGSSAPGVDATRVLAEMLPAFGGKGGGNRTVATARGEPGGPLERALDLGRRAVTEQATAAVGA
ncbi:MAG: alanine--tRNA ligase [Thermoplasmata archaeon]|nr:alanine--tRNA ligase [Thermoplasmata archaeon]